jgi:hypothetical protein
MLEKQLKEGEEGTERDARRNLLGYDDQLKEAREATEKRYKKQLKDVQDVRTSEKVLK